MLIINSEYLVAPLLCTGNCIGQYVEDLRIINEIVVNSDIEVFKELDIISEMGKANFYPSDSAFRKIISQDKNSIHSAQDIVRILYRLVNAVPEYNNNIDSYDIEWNTQSTVPALSYLSEDRELHYKNLFNKTIFNSLLSQEKYFIFSLQKNSLFSTNLKVAVETGIIHLEPMALGDMPINFKEDVTLFGNVRDVIIKFSGYEIYKGADSLQGLKLAFYFGVLNYSTTNNINRSISWGDFDIGESFYDSLVVNQCANSQKFSSLLYDMVLRIICRKPEDIEVNPFRKSKDSKEQIVFEGLKGFRCHLTKHHEGLRLMFWVEPETRRIILANVGAKMEEEIAKP
ncbi:hypothetical protein LLS47_23465 [Rouxiella badensis]|uniref:hypothetical protein n=1 Tax=Rouxiella badensis TaxID=1646377 RepID=UPI001D13513B|nr:hypothetical protein [Rouxiella badensis]MCC3735867.1 hypothetical protein [Rouxiella badensis]MCC3761281.1 hypothetical protein [Rouxiella badensis]